MGEKLSQTKGIGFSLLLNGTTSRRRKLVDTRGYTYNVHRETGNQIDWCCCLRNKKVYCRASVKQEGKVFQLGPNEHCHEPNPEVKAKSKRRPSSEVCSLRKTQKSNSSLRDGGNSTKLLLKQRENVPGHTGTHSVIVPSAIKYRIINDGTRCGRQKLVDSLGFEYNVKCMKNNVTYWWCTVRNKTVHCRASVSQRGKKFKVGIYDHCHEPAFKPKMKLAKSEVSARTRMGTGPEDTFEVRGESLTFKVVSRRQQRGVILVDSEGYSYKLKRQKEDHSYWTCAEQSNTHHCSATVSQWGNKFRLGRARHCHKPSHLPDLQEADVDSRSCTVVNVNEIVAKCLKLEMSEEGNLRDVLDDSDDEEYCEALKSRQNQHYINTEHIPKNFLQRDIRVDEQQHLILGFEDQICLLSRAHSLYLDKSFKEVSQPPFQLFTISTFAQLDEEIKHVALVFVLMSRCYMEDYLKVLEAISEIVAVPLVVANPVVASGDVALWEAAAKIFSGCKLQGCPYYWGRSVWKRMQELGLEQNYYENDQDCDVINCLLALPFLPEKNIVEAFKNLQDKVKGCEKLESLLQFIDMTWISSLSWDVSSWSLFMQPVRAKEDIDSWCIDTPLRNEKLPFYRLMWQFLREANLVSVQNEIASREKLESYQRNLNASIQKDVFYLWDMYTSSNLNQSLFLREMGMLWSHVIK